MVRSVPKLKCVYANIQSLINKKHEVEQYVLDEQPDMLFFTECFITEDHAASEYTITGFQNPVVFMKNRGGACIYVRSGINFCEVLPPIPTNDSAWITINTEDNIKRLYACIYRSPNSSVDNNNNLIENLRWARENFRELLVAGDFNYPSINWNTGMSADGQSQSFADIIDNLGLEQMVDECTRFREGQNSSLLDLILTDKPSIVCDIKYEEPFGKSDHVKIVFQLSNSYVVKPEYHRLRDFKKMDEQKFEELAGQVDWDDILLISNLDDA